MIEAIDLPQLEFRLRQHVEILAQAPRTPTSAAHRDAADYIADTLQHFGFLVREASNFEAGLPCTNLLTEPLPADPNLPLLIVGAHYDSVRGSPGADDNASAVAALLELGRWIAPQLRGPLGCRLQLAAYDLEEYGMVGSALHSQEIRKAAVPVGGMISLEMLGYTATGAGSQQLPPHLVGLYPDVGNFIGVCGNEESQELVRIVTEGLKSVAGLPVEFITVPGKGKELYEVRLSDHSSFWDADFKALMITDTSFFRNPHYHKASDTAETLDYAFMAKVTAGTCAAVRQLLA